PVLGPAGHLVRSGKVAGLRTGEPIRPPPGKLVGPRIGEAVRRAGQAGGPSGSRGGPGTGSKELVGPRIGRALRTGVGQAGWSSDRRGGSTGWTGQGVPRSFRTGPARSGKPTGLRVRGAVRPNRRSGRQIPGSVGRKDKWGPVISYMTGPHTFVHDNFPAAHPNHR